MLFDRMKVRDGRVVIRDWQTTTFKGLPITIENPVGSTREGTDENGNKWKTKFKHPYGFLQGTTGRDNEEADVFIGPDEESNQVYIIRQRVDGKPDEDKIHLGFQSLEDAKKAFLEHVDNPDMMGDIMEVPFDEFVKMTMDRSQIEVLRDNVSVLEKELKDIPLEIRYYKRYKELQQKLKVAKDKLKAYIREG